MSMQHDTSEDVVLRGEANPIDSVEEVLSSHNWVFNRMNDDELMVQVSGKACEYKLFFIWQEDIGVIQFGCQYEMPVSEDNFDRAARAVLQVNENLGFGHFDLPAESKIPCFRYTSFLQPSSESNFGQIKSMVRMSLALCERYQHLFHILSLSEKPCGNTMELALMETVGRS
ncbi:MAG: YbjN domain-containing protein [Alphaproteobacteria bacterium]|nr:YbjN domain-containing protein [Alphaproteobacteria bacterium]